MFRRRPIRRPIRRAMRPQARPGVPRALVLANECFKAGDYAQAAKRFAAIANAAESRGGPRAPQFYFQAGRASILDGQHENGLALLKQGLALLAERGEPGRLHKAGKRLTGELEGHGLKQQAGEISAWIKSNLPEDFTPMRERPVRKAVLPTHCPSCGAAVRSDEVDWMDEITAECAYCGSPVREQD